MIHLIYKSVARVPLSALDLGHLLQASRENNASRHITSLLVYHDDTFLQALEGPEEAVEETFERISLDPRHSWIQVLCRGSISHRVFVDWPLGFINGRTGWLNGIEEFSELCNAKGSCSREDGIRAARFLAEFRVGKWKRRVDSGQSLVGAGVGICRLEPACS